MNIPDTIVAGGHFPESDWAGELTALEARAEIDSLEGLQQERRQILPEYAALRALHGPGGRFDFKRKAMLGAIAVRVRMEAQGKQVKMTEAAIDDAAHADEQYVRLIDEGISGATRYVELETRISEITERIENRNASMYFVGQEMKLAR